MENGIIIRPVVTPAATAHPGAHRDHGFHTVRIGRIEPETADAASFVLDVPPDLAEDFRYEAGQFCTFRAVIDGQVHLRCYSMSSTPGVDAELQVTVKRVPDGLVSNWMLDHLEAGDEIDVTLPAGVFQVTDRASEVVAFAGGSGITPVLSITKQVLATTDRPVRLLYANRDAASTIFRAALDALAVQHPDRFRLQHHHDVDGGFLDVDGVRAFAEEIGDADVYVCGPGPFMDLVESTLLGDGVAPERIHIERFTPAEPVDDPVAAEPDATMVTIELDGRTDTVEHRTGTTILQTARQMGMSPPFSCESGSCATCMGKLLEGTVAMKCNNALDEDEVAQGWILTCQSVPTSGTISVRYGYED
jgi:3-ketosteroid 9alpha-monooxygenase subunit B